MFTHGARDVFPRHRYLGNAILSFLTKIASGYWHIADPEAGYTAINLETLQLLDLDRLYPRYGFENDILVHLNVWSRRVRDIPARPIYGVGEQSGIRLRRVVPAISWLLFKGFFWRLKEKYMIRDFHPLVLFYGLGLVLGVAGLGLGIAITVLRIMGNEVTPATVVLIALLLISGIQFTLFAMLFDMEANKDLRCAPQPGLRARITFVSPGQSQKTPSGDRDLSNCRTSPAKSSTRSPNRCGAA